MKQIKTAYLKENQLFLHMFLAIPGAMYLHLLRKVPPGRNALPKAFYTLHSVFVFLMFPFI